MTLALIKTIDFRFSNLPHSALVSVSGSGDEIFIHVQLFHSFLKKIFGVEHIRFSKCKGEIKLQDMRHPFVQQVARLVSSKLDQDIENIRQESLHAV